MILCKNFYKFEQFAQFFVGGSNKNTFFYRNVFTGWIERVHFCLGISGSWYEFDDYV